MIHSVGHRRNTEGTPTGYQRDTDRAPTGHRLDTDRTPANGFQCSLQLQSKTEGISVLATAPSRSSSTRWSSPLGRRSENQTLKTKHAIETLGGQDGDQWAFSARVNEFPSAQHRPVGQTDQHGPDGQADQFRPRDQADGVDPNKRRLCLNPTTMSMK